MRQIIITNFVSLDGVMQSPGGPEEDPTNDFIWGGWTANLWDEIMNKTMEESLKNPYDFLLGRKTYEIFAAHWPFTGDATSEHFNKITKYVVSANGVELTWENSVLITGDVINEIGKLKSQDGPDLVVNGSSRLTQTLLANKLVDLVYLWIFPTTIGEGKRFFEDGTQPGQWDLLDLTKSTTGVLIASYKPAGQINLGSFALDPPTEAEIKRREKLNYEL